MKTNNIYDNCGKRGCSYDWYRMPIYINGSSHIIMFRDIYSGVFREEYDSEEILCDVKSIMDKNRETGEEGKEEEANKVHFKSLRAMLCM